MLTLLIFSRLHVNIELAGVDQYTGIPLEQEDRQSTMDGPIGESDLLPEERFHRADMISQHMIDTRERQRQEKVLIRGVQSMHSLFFLPEDSVLRHASWTSEMHRTVT